MKLSCLLKFSPLLAVCAVCAVSTLGLPAHATDGMLMEGYGPVSTGMGGASQAIDHGTAGMAQNPATLALMASPARLDVALPPTAPSRLGASAVT